MRVHSSPHALCLKALPLADYPLPEKIIYTARTMHVPTECLSSQTRLEMLRLEAIFFLQFNGKISQPVWNPVRKAEATARLLTNALNPRSHPGEGLDAAIEIVSRAHCFELLSSKLQLTCELIKATFLKNISAGN
jgi:hypothetical protein